MNIDSELRLSYYRELAGISERHPVKLVQHTVSGKIFVLKTLKVYDARVYRYIADHPVRGIPRIEETIEDDGTLYVVEEYISGTSLQERLDASGPVSEPEAAGIIRQLCAILAPLHALTPPIVHRDIKPDNLLMMSDGSLFLVDLNSAKEAGDPARRDTVLIGTVGYAAPEQYGFSSSQPTADIYAIGVLLNKMLTGCLPDQQLYGGKLGKVISGCLKMDPSDRYQSVDELMRDMPAGERPRRTLSDRIRPWLPPGLRSRRPGVVIWGIIWYILMVPISLTLKVEGAGAEETLANRLTCLLMLLLETLWLGNYRDVWKLMPISNSDRPGRRAFGVTVWSFVLIFVLMLILTLLTDALWA